MVTVPAVSSLVAWPAVRQAELTSRTRLCALCTTAHPCQTRSAAGCCRLLLAAAGYCWLLLAALASRVCAVLCMATLAAIHTLLHARGRSLEQWAQQRPKQCDTPIPTQQQPAHLAGRLAQSRPPSKEQRCPALPALRRGGQGGGALHICTHLRLGRPAQGRGGRREGSSAPACARSPPFEKTNKQRLSSS